MVRYYPKTLCAGDCKNIETADSQLVDVLYSNAMKGGDKTENNQSNKSSIWIVKFSKNWE